MNFLNRFRQRKTSEEHNMLTMDSVKSRSLPRHVSIIMDGNGLGRKKGTSEGSRSPSGSREDKEIIKASAELGIQYLTLYAFSTENWKRPKEEIKAIMSLLVEYLRRELDELHRNNIKIVTIGILPPTRDCL